MKTPPLARTPEEWAEAVRPLGGRAFHGKQVFRWIHARGVVDENKMTDLPASLREALVADGMDRVLDVAVERRALDRTRKLLVKMADGATVETVLIPGVSGHKGVLPSPLALRPPAVSPETR